MRAQAVENFSDLHFAFKLKPHTSFQEGAAANYKAGAKMEMAKIVAVTLGSHSEAETELKMPQLTPFSAFLLFRPKLKNCTYTHMPRCQMAIKPKLQTVQSDIW